MSVIEEPARVADSVATGCRANREFGYRLVQVIGGGDDPFIPVNVRRAVYRAAHDPPDLWIALGLDHDGISDTQNREYCRRVLAFRQETIGTPHPAR